MTAWDADRWHAATGELELMLGRNTAERAAALEALRAHAPRLADDVAQLLHDHEDAQAAAFLEHGAGALLTTTSASPIGAAPRPAPSTPLPPDTTLGAYRVRRVLGRGGMGLVYEADEIESGRRVALKVLQQRFGDERERERFEREGRLAASIDHEHCVFVFGAAEIDGVPAIAMELMQGTLADRLVADGALPPAAAVDMTLQLVAGLQAAGDAGILHRDVKPSNCFVDADGVVKIGDFGISRLLRPAEDTALSTRNQLAATPTYASPEQLRGGTLDARADIYSLGATLYELVTGRRPFTAPDLMSLLMAVANDVPEPPHRIAPAVPAGLGKVILRCLAKKPEDRYATYAALAAALAPYASVSPSPATLGRRFIAGAIDHLVLGVLNLPIVVTVVLPMVLSAPSWRPLLIQMAATLSLTLLYYGGSEALWACTPGKALLGLLVVDRHGRPARPGTAFARAVLYSAPNVVIGLSVLSIWGPAVTSLAPDMRFANIFISAGQLLIFATVFSTARRRNGYAALHDLASGSRVVERRATVAVERAAVAPAPMTAARPAIGRRGPFAVLAGTIQGWPGLPGVDDRLRRPIWIRDLPIGTPAVPAARVSLARPTRLRWLAGRRTLDEAWDVYEAVAGLPLAEACRTRRPWAEVRRWLVDLAAECAAQKAGDQPPLALDRVWILDSGRAKLLDDPTGDPTPDGNRTSAVVGLLLAVARLARAGGAEPWPVAASRFVDRLATTPPAAVADVARDAEALGRGRTAITRGWRALALAGLLAFPVAMTLMAAGGLWLLASQIRSAPVDARIVSHVLRRLEPRASDSRTLAPADRDAVEIVLASRYRSTLADARIYAPERFLLLTPAHKAIADAILRREVDAGSAAAASARPIVRELFAAGARFDIPPVAPIAVTMLFGTLAVVALLGLLAAVATRGVILRVLGFELVTADGRLAGRWRVFFRAAVAWAPILAPALVATTLSGVAYGVIGLMIALGAALAVLLAGAIVAIAAPSRGLQDCLAGTWIVPR